MFSCCSTLETNFTTGIGRFLGFRNTTAITSGPGTQTSGGSSNITSLLGTGGSFLTQAGSLVNGGSINAGAPGTIGATFTNTTNEVISLTGTTTPLGSFAQNSINTGSIRQGLGASQSQGANQASTAAADYTQPSLLGSNSVGAAQSQAVGVDTLTFVNGNTFSTSGSEETVTGCEQATGGAVYGAGDGNSTSLAACSSRGQFVGSK
eukprot:TRINITY_DN3542_c0_g1_i1.p2 TRINITY_DN3542_c0_g1~~TRINITY_DN3542_c0_g1_i1.p2  ORF type:complete len:207 (+),score=42.84 TRINITY_DN3542_c0_g1_i1:130-750(+)